MNQLTPYNNGHKPYHGMPSYLHSQRIAEQNIANYQGYYHPSRSNFPPQSQYFQMQQHHNQLPQSLESQSSIVAFSPQEIKFNAVNRHLYARAPRYMPQEQFPKQSYTPDINQHVQSHIQDNSHSFEVHQTNSICQPLQSSKQHYQSHVTVNKPYSNLTYNQELGMQSIHQRNDSLISVAASPTYLETHHQIYQNNIGLKKQMVNPPSLVSSQPPPMPTLKRESPKQTSIRPPPPPLIKMSNAKPPCVYPPPPPKPFKISHHLVAPPSTDNQRLHDIVKKMKVVVKSDVPDPEVMQVSVVKSRNPKYQEPFPNEERVEEIKMPTPLDLSVKKPDFFNEDTKSIDIIRNLEFKETKKENIVTNKVSVPTTRQVHTSDLISISCLRQTIENKLQNEQTIKKSQTVSDGSNSKTEEHSVQRNSVTEFKQSYHTKIKRDSPDVHNDKKPMQFLKEMWPLKKRYREGEETSANFQAMSEKEQTHLDFEETELTSQAKTENVPTQITHDIDSSDVKTESVYEQPHSSLPNQKRLAIKGGTKMYTRKRKLDLEMEKKRYSKRRRQLIPNFRDDNRVNSDSIREVNGKISVPPRMLLLQRKMLDFFKRKHQPPRSAKSEEKESECCSEKQEEIPTKSEKEVDASQSDQMEKETCNPKVFNFSLQDQNIELTISFKSKNEEQFKQAGLKSLNANKSRSCRRRMKLVKKHLLSSKQDRLPQSLSRLNLHRSSGESYMHRAAKINSVELFNDIINYYGAEMIMKQDYAGNTPLHISCIYDSYEVAELILVNNSSIIDVPCVCTGQWPIHEAVMRDSLRLVNLLLNYGADIRQKNFKCESPLSLSRSVVLKDYIICCLGDIYKGKAFQENPKKFWHCEGMTSCLDTISNKYNPFIYPEENEMGEDNFEIEFFSKLPSTFVNMEC